WLNTTWLDERFRIFSGHTQVNATDLRNLPYPTSEQLACMGRMLEAEQKWSQQIFDKIAMETANGK
ncbi:MAG: SAM-dependent methyltransferase, partial [Kiritimatiellae bacterium]|nr:SAM-dependent methyltransferase [Kiritimatiellia bacterium]